MFVSSLFLKNFRIHSNTKLEFSNKINFIVGGNGQGKTSIIEALYFLCTTKNFKSASDVEIIKFEQEAYEIEGLLKDITEDKIRIYFSLSENKRYYIQNGKQISKSADIIGKYPVVLLTPDDHFLTQGYPVDRRKFVDSVISQASGIYLKTLLDYNKTLKQRAFLLNRINESGRKDLLQELDAWTEKLILSGCELIKYRLKFVADFNNFIRQSYKTIMLDEEEPTIEYQYIGGIEEEIQTIFKKAIEEKQNEEIRRGTNLVGPHRDEFIFKINNNSVRTFGSQGQHKTFQVALRFAQFFYLKEKSGRLPIFLLDDVFGELDVKRSVRISEFLKEVGQALITITDFSNLSFLEKGNNDLIINVNGGKISYA